MLVWLGIVRWVTFGFLRVGHTHENIDQLFAQVVSNIRHATFDTPTDVLGILQRLCRRSDQGLVRANAHRLGQTACWKDWGDRVGAKFAGHAGKGCRRMHDLSSSAGEGVFAKC